ncbi:MAG TPA: SRPBCC family protein [Bacteroidales bacterium]|nr:SRPBCC family protein [Bacteroidales bacterium]
MYQLIHKTFIKSDIETVWDFFSSPQNLKKITPAKMGFNIVAGGEGRMYPGQIIAYKVKPLFGIPLLWVTEITQVSEGKFFVDEQRIGPYRMWHHEHHFVQVEGGVEMTDIVSYALPFGPLGALVHKILVKREVENIFKFRQKVINRYFITER